MEYSNLAALRRERKNEEIKEKIKKKFLREKEKEKKANRLHVSFWLK